MTQDNELANVFANMSGVEVTHHYPGTNKYYVHCKVNDEAYLRKLLDYAEAVNCAVLIYTSGEEYRYTVVITPDSRELVLMNQ